jgi:hypothetical protein
MKKTFFLAVALLSAAPAYATGRAPVKNIGNAKTAQARVDSGWRGIQTDLPTRESATLFTAKTTKNYVFDKSAQAGTALEIPAGSTIDIPVARVKLPGTTKTVTTYSPILPIQPEVIPYK